MKKLNALGIGPKIGMVAIPWFITALLLSIYKKEMFYVGEKLDFPLFILGIVMLSIGIIFYGVSARFLLKGIKTTTLQTGGTYYLCQNPLYVGIILFVLPGISFMMHTWLILTTSIVAYIIFKVNIKSEYKEMEEFFGDAYREYRKKTPEFCPFPWKKWFKMN
jgi:protein-S-isoprenylcysteine O-methyltransferase Ste14